MPGLQSVASATVDPGVEQPAGVGVRRAGGELHARQQRGDRVAAGQRVDVGVGEVGAVVDARRAELDRELHAGAGRELVAVHAQPEPGGPAGRAASARASSPSKACGLAGSQNTSIHRACGAQAASIGPVTSSTYSAAVDARRDDVRAEERRLRR